MGLSGCVCKVGAVTHPAEHLRVSEAHLSGVWPVPAGACLPDAPGGLLVGQTLHLDTNKQSEGSRCLSLDWEFILVLSRTGGWGGCHHKVSKAGGEKPSCLLSPASLRTEDDLWGAGHTHHEEGPSPAS